MGRWRERRAWRWRLARTMARFTVEVRLPALDVVTGVTVWAVAVVLHFLTKAHTLPWPCLLWTSVLLGSMHQRRPWSLVQGFAGWAAEVSIGDFVGGSLQASIAQQGAVGL